MKSVVHRSALILAVICISTVQVGASGEASPGGARQALDSADILTKALNSGDPSDATDAVQKAVRLIPTLEAMASVLDASALNIAAIRADFEKEAAKTGDAATTAFYESEVKTMKGREADLSDLRSKLSRAVAQLREKVDKAKANPKVQALLKDDEVLQRATDALEKLKGIKLPKLDP
jgi:hypothetical protein